jgi:glycosyltransferase involved in cell wall biosynthesis
MVHIANGIAARGIACDLVLAQAKGPFLADVADGVRVVDLRSWSTFTALLPLVKYLRRERPSAVLSGLENANVICVLARWLSRAKSRAVVTVHNNYLAISKERQSPVERATVSISARLYRWADAVVAVSEGVADDAARRSGLPRDSIRTILNPVVTDRLFTLANEPLHHDWLRPGMPPVLITVGRLADAKDHSTLVRAFASVRKRTPCRLVILGDGPKRAELQSLCAELGVQDDVLLPGFVDNPYAWIRRSGVFVLSSVREGLPTVLIEALALEVPIVSTDCESGPREILGGGLHGTLVPVRSPDLLAAAIEAALRSARRPVPRDAWAPYTRESAVCQYLDVLEDVDIA